MTNPSVQRIEDLNTWAKEELRRALLAEHRSRVQKIVFGEMPGLGQRPEVFEIMASASARVIKSQLAIEKSNREPSEEVQAERLRRASHLEDLKRRTDLLRQWLAKLGAR